jgi:hypothetical protein
MNRALSILACVLLTSASAWCGDEQWQYVVPAAGALHHSPPESPLLLSPEAPEDLNVTVVPRGKDLLYAQLRYGGPGSVRIAVAVDQPPDAPPILYVDANRDRHLAQDERVEATESGWETTLSVSDPAIASGSRVDRRVAFRLGRTKMVLGYATLGYVEGQVELGSKTCSARRMDCDGNGLLTDARDRIWLDLDADGTWSSFGEQFSFAPILRLGEARWALHSDPLGHGLTCESIVGFGRIRLLMNGTDGKPRKDVLAVQVSLAGKDGTAVGILGHDVPVEVPIGEYRITMVTLTLSDTKGRGAWSFAFSDPGGKRERIWHAVAKDAQVTLDPIGPLSFGGGLDPAADPPEAGGWVRVRPTLLTSEGLLINSCSRGAGGWAESPRARSLLRDQKGVILSTADSGFA